MSQRYDLIVIGTGFAGSFFLMRYLQRAPATALAAIPSPVSTSATG